MIRPLSFVSASIVLAVFGATATAAQVQIEKRRPVPPAGELSIENAFGIVTVRAWDQKEVLVRGTLAAGAEGLSFDGDKEDTWLSVDVPDHWFHASDDDTAFRSVLEVFAPAGSSVWVETVNADVDLEGFRGRLEVETVNGGIRLAGAPAEVEVDTLTGRVQIDAGGAPVAVSSVSGPVVLSGAAGEVEVETVAAPVEITAAAIRSLSVTSTTGAVTFRGGLARAGQIQIQTFSGPVTLVLAQEVHARFELTSFSGQITSALGAGTPPLAERFQPYRRLRFSTGVEEFEVQVETHDADITIEVQ